VSTIRTLDDIDAFMRRFAYKPDPLWGLIDIQHDLPSFIKRGGGDCDDFALAVCRLAQALGLKAYYVTGLSWNIFKNHSWAIVKAQRKYYIFTPYRIVFYRVDFETIDEAIEAFQNIFDARFFCIHVFNIDEI